MILNKSNQIFPGFLRKHQSFLISIVIVNSLYQRLLGKKVIFITGTDEHGEKIATAATASGSSPIEHCNNISQAYKFLWKDVRLV